VFIVSPPLKADVLASSGDPDDSTNTCQEVSKEGKSPPSAKIAQANALPRAPVLTTRVGILRINEWFGILSYLFESICRQCSGSLRKKTKIGVLER
jgi:hypothetical protein